MHTDFESQIDRAKELFNDLEKACNADLLSKKVSDKTKNLSQEVLLKMRHLLDQAIYQYFEKHYFPKLSSEDRKTAKVYFPIVGKKEGLKSVLGRAKMEDLETSHHDFYVFLDSVQPYNVKYAWLKQFADLCAEKHIRLTPQVKSEAKRITVSRGGGAVSWGPGVTFGGGVSVMGVPIDPATQLPVPNNFAETKIETWVSFLYEGTSINVLGLCKRAIEDGEAIAREVMNHSSA
jgi:hypothetical protein